MSDKNNRTEMSTTKIIKCKECEGDIRVDKAVKEATCWKCKSRKILEQVEGRKVKEKGKKKRRAKNSGKGDHMSPEAIRARFDGDQGDRKLGFFQQIFLLIKDEKKIDLEELAEKAFELESKPERYNEVTKIKKQIRYYCSTIWGKKSDLVQVRGNTITYKG